MENTIYQIYDKIFKKILTLSSKSVINLINGLFETDYSPDSTVEYHWTEFMDDTLKRILADTILTIDGKYSYHMEAQMTKDDSIIFRVFEYGFSHANRHGIQKEDYYELPFPEPKIIYLCPEPNLPDQYTLRLNFGSQGYFDYKVNTYCFNKISTQELNDKKMVILIPFKLLNLRRELEKSRSTENLVALKNLIQNDIIGSIEDNLRLNNITIDDARKLKRLTHKLYEHIYSHYDEMEVLNDMTDESLMLDIDYIEKEYEEKIDAVKRKLVTAEQRLEATEQKLENTEQKLENTEQERDAMQAEISRLKDLLKENGLL